MNMKDRFRPKYSQRISKDFKGEISLKDSKKTKGSIFSII